MTPAILPGVTIRLIQTLTARRFKIPPEQMTTPDRKWEFAHPRQLAMALAFEFTGHSKVMIGGRFGGRDHTTVLWAVRQVEARAALDAQAAEDLRFLRALLDQLKPKPMEAEPVELLEDAH